MSTYVLELNAPERAALRRKLRGEKDDLLRGIAWELEDQRPHRGYTVVAPAAAVPYIQILTGGPFRDPHAWAIVAEDESTPSRRPHVAHNPAYVSRAIAGAKARKATTAALSELQRSLTRYRELAPQRAS
jgi:hypothetical protein